MFIANHSTQIQTNISNSMSKRKRNIIQSYAAEESGQSQGGSTVYEFDVSDDDSKMSTDDDFEEERSIQKSTSSVAASTRKLRASSSKTGRKN